MVNQLPNITSPILISGTISEYSESFCPVDFKDVGPRSEGQAAFEDAMAPFAQNTSMVSGFATLSHTNPAGAKLVRFKLGDKEVAGWLWGSIFKNGDVVSVVAEPREGGRFECFAIKRPVDKCVAVYPYSGTGRNRIHRVTWMMAKFFGVGALLFACVMTVMNYFLGGTREIDLEFGGGFLFLEFIAWIFFISLGYRTDKDIIDFCPGAEKIFKCFGWPEPENIDITFDTFEYKARPTDRGFITPRMVFTYKFED